MKSFFRIPNYLLLIVTTFLWFVLWQTIYRLVFLILNSSQGAAVSEQDLIYAFFNRGLLFDTYISTIALLLPVVILWFSNVFSVKPRFFFGYKIFVTVIFAFLILFQVNDIGYYTFYNSRLSSMILIWFESPKQLVLELFNNALYVVLTVSYVMLVIALSWLYFKWATLITKQPKYNLNWPSKIGVTLCLLLALFFGIRGSFDFEDTPLIGVDAIFSEVPFANQLATNPVHSFFDSFGEQRVEYTSNELAIAFVQKELGIEHHDARSPIQRSIVSQTPTSHKNVVILLIESYSDACVNRKVNGKPMMPFLDALIGKSIYFKNAFSSGIHTHNGVFSTFYGMPAILGNNTLSNVKTSNQKFDGLPHWLKTRGYSTAFYTCGDKTFDNMVGFCQNNGFDKVFGEDDYSKEYSRSSWGVYDYDLLQELAFGIEKMKQPFFASVLTISTHFGFEVKGLKRIKHKTTEPNPSTYGYTDSSIANFFEIAKSTSWYENTVFVILGDHGQRFDPKYEAPINYNHIPILIFDPSNSDGVVVESPVMQIDVGAVLMGLLGGSYLNNTLGINVLKKPRKYAFFCADNTVGVVDSSFYFLQVKGQNKLYDFLNFSFDNLCSFKTEKCGEMERYGLSNLQVTQYMQQNNLTAAE